MESRILIIDDEVHVLRALLRALQDEGYEVVTATNAEDALELVRRHKFKVIITDERMPGMYGSELLATISLRQPEVVKMMLTGYASVEAAIRAVNEGEIYRFLVKPWDDFELKMSIRAGIEKYDLEMKNRKLQALVRSITS
jgi:DNA-binding NtrC family response regulator